jgi:hypothetical protein
VGEAAEPEPDALDPLDQVVGCLGGPARHPGSVPGDDVVVPAAQGPAQGADLDRVVTVEEVVSELGDEGVGLVGVVNGVDAPNGLLSVNRP